jgi:hypothetical protein
MRRLALIGVMMLLAVGRASGGALDGDQGGGQGGGRARGVPRGAEGGPDDFRDPSHEEDGPRRPHTQLFISPAGQPFHAPMGEPYPVAAWFAQADHDHDGKLTREEFRADAEAWFKILDVNSDGQISMPEVTHWEDDLVPEITQPTFGGYGGGRPGPLSRNKIDTRAQGAATYSLINEPHPIRGADADFSMGVSLREWRAAADRRFALLDVDGDGSIALADLQPTPAQRLYAREPGGHPHGGGPPGGGASRGPPPH